MAKLYLQSSLFSRQSPYNREGCGLLDLRRMPARLGLLVTALAVLGEAPAIAQRPGELEEIRRAIADAEAARASTLETLTKLDKLIIKLRAEPAIAAGEARKSATDLALAGVQQRIGKNAELPSTPRSPLAEQERQTALRRDEAETVRLTKLSQELRRPEGMPACSDDQNMGKYVANPGRKEGVLAGDKDTAEHNRGLNAFTYHCLGLTRAREFDPIALSIQLNAQSGSEELGGQLEWRSRWLTTSNGGGLAAGYRKIWAGAFGKTDGGKTTVYSFADNSAFSSGAGLVGGIEFGRSSAKSQEAVAAQFKAGLSKARQACFADALAKEPGSDNSPATQCSDDGFTRWLSDGTRRSAYWRDIVAPIWGVGQQPATFFGVQGRLAWAKEDYRNVTTASVMDPVTNHTTIVSTVGPKQTLEDEVWALKAYLGRGWTINRNGSDNSIGFTMSATHRREVAYPDQTQKKTICDIPTPGSNVIRCSATNIAQPALTTGVVLGGAVHGQLGRYWYLPPIASSLQVTYATDTTRWGIEVPVYFLADAEGKLRSGLRFATRSKGRIRDMFEIGKEDWSVSFFAGTAFSLSGTP